MSDLTKYLRDWDNPSVEGDQRRNASGADSSGQVDGQNYDGGVAARWPMPETPQWGIGKDGNSGGYGHSSDCEENTTGATWGLSKDQISAGYERLTPGKSPEGRVQDIPARNEHNRAQDDIGTGHDPKRYSNAGGESVGSSSLKPSAQGD